MPMRLMSALLAAAVVHASINADSELLRSKWYHEEDHPVHGLFRRGGSNDGVSYAAIGTAQWSAGFPPGEATTANMPQAWVNALNAAVTAGKIPDIPASTLAPGEENPTYPSGYDPNSPQVCSATYKCRTSGDTWDAPAGVLGLSFDDGPLLPSTKLCEFLAKNNQRATHFMIGTNILTNYEQFKCAFGNGDDIAVHTWTHPYMTTKSNLEVTAELGWTMWLIHNSSGGRVPRFWRPPFGDSDMRVRAIAKEVFGLSTVVWNQDTDDWTLDQKVPTTSLDKIASQMQTWLAGPKNPGLIILEHELSDLSVQSFISAYPLMISNGWKVLSLAQIDGLGGYLNALDSGSPVTPVNVGVPGVKPPQANTSTANKAASSPSHGTGSGSQSSSAHRTSASPHADQKSGADHFTSAASFVLSGIATFISAVAGSLLL